MALLILPAVVQLVLNKSETPHISASLKFDTIQAMVRQFGQTVDFQAETGPTCPVLRGGFANKIKSEDVNRAQEKIMKDRL